MDLNQTYVVQNSGLEFELTQRFRSSLRWAWDILARSTPEGLDTKLNKDGPALVTTKFSSSFVNRLGNRKPVYIFVGQTAHDRPMVKVRIRDFQRGHDTVYQEPLRTDGSNAIGPDCSAQQVQDFLNLLHSSTYKTAFDGDPDEGSGLCLRPLLSKVEDIASVLIHASRDCDPTITDGLFFLSTGQPYSLPNILYSDTIADGQRIAPLLREDAAALLAKHLPPLIHLAERSTSRMQGYQLGAYTSHRFVLADRLPVIEEMKILADFSPTDTGYTLPLEA